jgi:anti-sigma factor RsiW
MKKDGNGHVLSNIQACADGELAREEEAQVRAHCGSCASCGAALAELEAFYSVLESDEDRRLLHPVWPRVLERIERRRSPFARVPFAVSASAAAAAGLLIGLLLGASGGIGAAEPGNGLQGDWSEIGSTLTGAGTTLDDLYLADGASGEETK